MPLHSAAAIRRLLRRNGVPVAVRRKSGTLNLVTSRRTGVVELQVDTYGVRPRAEQRSKLGDPLATEEAYYLVPVEPFRGVFEPRDGDLVMDAGSETVVLSVRTWHGVRGESVAYKLVVSGVAL